MSDDYLYLNSNISIAEAIKKLQQQKKIRYFSQKRK